MKHQTKFKCVGGPSHGKVMQMPSSYDGRYTMPAVDATNAQVKFYDGAYDPASYCFKTITYLKREVTLGQTRVYVLAPEGMEEPEFSRRLADIIEQ